MRMNGNGNDGGFGYSGYYLSYGVELGNMESNVVLCPSRCLHLTLDSDIAARYHLYCTQ